MALDPSILSNGSEQYEEFESRGRTFIQYDYRGLDGVLFSCVASTLEKCREKRIASEKQLPSQKKDMHT